VRAKLAPTLVREVGDQRQVGQPHERIGRSRLE
jgi:hypothetical protein